MRLGFILLILLLTGCSSHKLTGYNLKGNVGQTTDENGERSLYTGGSIDAHFDVK